MIAQRQFICIALSVTVWISFSNEEVRRIIGDYKRWPERQRDIRSEMKTITMILLDLLTSLSKSTIILLICRESTSNRSLALPFHIEKEARHVADWDLPLIRLSVVVDENNRIEERSLLHYCDWRKSIRTRWLQRCALVSWRHETLAFISIMDSITGNTILVRTKVSCTIGEQRNRSDLGLDMMTEQKRKNDARPSMSNLSPRGHCLDLSFVYL